MPSFWPKPDPGTTTIPVEQQKIHGKNGGENSDRDRDRHKAETETETDIKQRQNRGSISTVII